MKALNFANESKSYEVLDVCCGGKMFWFDKNHPSTIFCDIRNESHVLCDGRTINISPMLISDYKALPFKNEQFSLVIFDPPHLRWPGDKSYMFLHYGKLPKDWKFELRSAFDECWRVLKKSGTLIFKWSEQSIRVSEILKIFNQDPLIGHKSGKSANTHWLTFMKL